MQQLVKTRVTPCLYCGTDGSNLAPSSAESIANLGFRGEDLVQPCDNKSIAKLVVTEVSDAALRGCTGRVQCPEIGTRSPGRFR